MKITATYTTILAAMVAPAFVAGAYQPALKPATGAGPKATVRAAGEREQGTRTGPRQEPGDSTSAILRAEQAHRREMRERAGWNMLDPQTQEVLWDEFVGPDQLNDGHGRAQVRPSEREGGFEPRDGGYDDRGPLVSLSWIYATPGTGNNQTTNDMFLNVEGDVLMTGWEFLPSGVKNIRVTEVRGTSDSTEGYTENWTRAYYFVDNPATNGSIWGYTCSADFLGNSYVAGKRGNGQYILHHYVGTDGSTIRQRAFSAANSGTDAFAQCMTVDPEGIVYVAGGWWEGPTTAAFVSRHDPSTNLQRTWLASAPGVPVVALESDRRGGIYAAYTTNDDHARVCKYGPYDGTPEWTWTSTSTDSVQAMALDSAGNPHLAVYRANGWAIIKLSEADGSPMWTTTPTVANGLPKDIVVDSSGNVYATGDSATHTSYLGKWNSNGNVPAGWVAPDYGTTGAGAKCVALDWLDNPYVMGSYGTTSQSIDTRKFDPATGAEVWMQTHSPTASGSETNRVLYPDSLVVDASGSVYASGHRYPTINGVEQGSTAYCIKYEQPFVSIPQTAKSNPNVRLEGHSVWLPEVEDIGQQGFNQTFSLFSFNLNSLMNEATVDDLLSAELDYVLGTVRGEIDLDLLSSPSLGVIFVTSATGGSYDATATGEMNISIPGEGELFAGQTFPVVLSFTPDSAGMEMLANSEPELSASLRSNTTGNIDLDVRGLNRNFGGDWQAIFDVDVPTPALSSLDNITLLNIFPGNMPPAGTWYRFDIAGVTGKVTMPQLNAEGVFSALTTSGQNTGNPNDDDRLRLASSLSETFCEVGVSVTDLITQAATGVPLSFGWDLPAGGDGTDVSAGIGLLQAHLDGDMKMEQDLTLDMKPYIRLEFPGTTLTPVTVDLVKRTGSSGSYTYVPESSTINIGPLPETTGAMEIKPYFGVRSTMRNKSGLRFGASAGFDTFSVNATVSVVDVDVFNLDYCLGCITQPIFSTPLTLLDRTSPEFSWNEVELASIQVSGDVNLQPQLIGTSRAAARMIIYEQRTPTAAELTAAAGGSEPMVLYGRKFFTGTGQANRAYIRHHGRTEQLTTTRLNDQALLVQVPKRFYLLPGIARLWVTNGNGRSKTIDFPIEHPFPNFEGIESLDGAADPAIWAGDPRRTTEAVVAIDGGTPAGNDSFIARRDYYVLLRTTLWNSGLFEAGDPDSGLTAQAYFPSFLGWELAGNPKCPPGFPTLVIDGVALGRARPFVNDGYFRSKLQPGLYALPHATTMELVNPGPGGGASRTLALTIPAPSPVLSHTEPPSITPDSVAAGGTLRMVVYGPDSVPYFAGYECVKAGNFTPNSVVRFDGVDVATTFANSGQLVAEIPAAMLSGVGAHLVSVFTPDGGTTYTEQTRNGSGSWNSPVTVASGGISPPVTFEVMWGRPVIASLSQDTVTVGQPPYTPTAIDGVPYTGTDNFGITGSNFAPGCTVYWNGRALPTTRVSDRALQVTLGAQDVATVGTVRVWVTNPAPSARSSVPVNASVVP